jgi:GrpB-like predicted nucleotidyltransferase (UPF0157 family)
LSLSSLQSDPTKQTYMAAITGLRKGIIVLQEHRPEWAQDFQEEKAKILEKIGDRVIDVMHIGSTAIRGIAAKPILDIGISIAHFDRGLQCVEPLAALGYLYKGENGIAERHYFRTNAAVITGHIHMFTVDHPALRDHLLFRDYLNEHPQEALRYHELKQQLARQNSNDREQYTLGKATFIREILEKARNISK